MDKEYKQQLEQQTTRDLVFGIYAYVCNKTGNVMYIGVDKHIDRLERHKDHLRPSKATEDAPRFQQIHKWLHENEHTLIILIPSIFTKELAEFIEVQLINYYNPPLNIKKTKHAKDAENS